MVERERLVMGLVHLTWTRGFRGLHTDFDGSLSIFIRCSTAAMFTALAHATMASWRRAAEHTLWSLFLRSIWGRGRVHALRTYLASTVR